MCDFPPNEANDRGLDAATRLPQVVESKPAPVTQTAPEVAAKAPATPSLDPQQVKQIGADVAAVRQAVERNLGRASNRRAACRQSRPDGARDREATGRQPGNSWENPNA